MTSEYFPVAQRVCKLQIKHALPDLDAKTLLQLEIHQFFGEKIPLAQAGSLLDRATDLENRLSQKRQKRSAKFSWSKIDDDDVKAKLVATAIATNYNHAAIETFLGKNIARCQWTGKDVCNVIQESVHKTLVLKAEKVEHRDGSMSLCVTPQGKPRTVDIVVLVIDVSTSMDLPLLPVTGIQSRKSHVSHIIPDIVAQIPDGTQVVQVAYSRTAHASPFFAAKKGNNQPMITTFFNDRETFSGGCTDIFGGFLEAATAISQTKASRAVVLALTDGDHNVPDTLAAQGSHPQCLEKSICALFEDMPCSVTTIGMSLSADSSSMEKYVDTMLFAESGAEVCAGFLSAMHDAFNMVTDNMMLTCSEGHFTPCCFTDKIATLEHATLTSIQEFICGASGSSTLICIRTSMYGLFRLGEVSESMLEAFDAGTYPAEVHDDLSQVPCTLIVVGEEVFLRDHRGIDNAVVFYTPPNDDSHFCFDGLVVNEKPYYFDVIADAQVSSFVVSTNDKVFDVPKSAVRPATDEEHTMYLKRKWLTKYKEVLRSKRAIPQDTLEQWLKDSPDAACKKMVQCQIDLHNLSDQGDSSALNAACHYRSLGLQEISTQKSYCQQHR